MFLENRSIYGNFSNESLYKIRQELLTRLREEKPEIHYEDPPNRTWFLHPDRISDDPQVIDNYLSMVELNDPTNYEELKKRIYTAKIQYDTWGLVLPVWGLLGLASLKEYYLVAREYYECSRTANY